MGNWLVLLPAISVFIISIISRNIILSLFTGIISACFISKDFNILKSINLLIVRVIEQINNLSHLYTFGFLISLGIIITLITVTGGAGHYSEIIEKKIKDKKAVETLTLIFSLFLFLDDYLNSLITGCIIKPLTDKFKIPKVKLAYLLDSISSSLCVLIPMSSWTALLLTEIKTSIVNLNLKSDLLLTDPFKIYLNSILFMFYPILSIMNAFIITRNKISYGPMNKYEIKAEKENIKENTDLKSCKNSSIWDFILPISSFLIFTLIFMLYLSNWSITKILNSNPLTALFYSSFLTLIFSIIYFTLNKKILFKDIREIFLKGFNLMKNSLIVLLLAWTLGSIFEQDLHTGQYIASILINSVNIFLIPATIFLTSIIISGTTGSAWGTIAIMMPLAIPTAINFIDISDIKNYYIIYQAVAAVISGAIAGGHISAISDSTIMASTSSGASAIDHLITQIPYVLPAIISSLIAFIISGLFISNLLSLAIAILTSISIIFLLNIYMKNSKYRSNFF